MVTIINSIIELLLYTKKPFFKFHSYKNMF